MNSTNSTIPEDVYASETFYPDYELLNTVYVTVNSFIPITFTLIGLAGNILSFVVYSRPCFKDTPTAFYLRVMAVTDILTLIDWPEMFQFNFGIDLKSFSSVTCKITIYFTYSIPAMSTWLLCTTSLDRMLNISFKNKFSFLTKRKFQMFLVIFIIVFNTVIYSPMLIYFDIVYEADQPY